MPDEHRNSLVISNNLNTTIGEVGITPPTVIRSGNAAAEKFLEFFAATLSNRNTRDAYYRACCRFFSWCEYQGIAHLWSIRPLHVAAYIESLGKEFEKPTVKQHLAAIRTLFDWLVIGQIVPTNPSNSVRGPKHIVRRGKTHALSVGEARSLLDSVPDRAIVDLRDRALIGLMLFGFARVGAVVTMQVHDYYPQGKRWWVRFREKGGKRHEMPVHCELEQYLNSYLNAAAIGSEKVTPLFRSIRGRSGALKHNGMTRVDVYRMVRRRALAAGLSGNVCCHTFRATGITAYLDNGGTLEKAQRMAAHESPLTTKLYDRTSDDIAIEEIERIKI